MTDFVDVTPSLPSGAQIIEGYGPTGFRISGALHAGAVLVCADRVWPVAVDLDSLSPADLAPLQDLPEPPTLLLIGTGARQRFPATALKAALRQKGLAVEAMTSPAACRTYNVLLAEGRRVAALLLPL